MNPRALLRYAAYGLGGLVAIALVAAAWIAATFDPNDYKDEVSALVQRSKGRDLRFDGPVKLMFWPNLGADLKAVRLSEPGGKGEFVAVDSLRASLQVMPLLSGRVVVNGVDVAGLRASIRRDADGRFNFADLLTKPEEKSERVAFDVASVRVRDSRIDYADASGTKLTIDGIEVKTGSLRETSARDVEVKARLADPRQPVSVQAEVASAEFGDTLGASGVQLKVASEGPSGKLDAQVDLQSLAQQAGKLAGEGFKLKAVVDAKDTRLDLRADTARFGQTDGGLQSAPLQVTVSGKAAGASLDLKLTSPLALDLAQKRLRLSAMDLRFSAKKQTVDLNGALKGPAEFALAAQTLRLPGFDLDLTAASPNLSGGPLAVRLGGDLDAGIAARKADLRFTGRVDGHTVSGTLAAEAAGTPALKADVRARDVDIARVIARVSPSDLLSGKGDLDLKVTTRGDTPPALTQALNGEGVVRLRDGAVKGLDLNSSLREATAAVRKALGKETGNAVKTKRTDFSEMLATFTIRDGVLDNRDLSLKSPLLRVAGAGTVDLVKGELDYGVKASLVATREGQGGADRSGVAGITVPVKLFGPLAAPQYSIDFASMLSADTLQRAIADPAAAKEAVRGAREQVKGVQDSVKDLKGLFGR